MTYVCSDLHGLAVEPFKNMLSSTGFEDGDRLYILGDVIDRNGDGGIELLEYIMSREDFTMLLGNHEDMLLRCRWLFNEVSDEGIAGLSTRSLEDLTVWMRNGCEPTIASLKKIIKTDKPRFDGLIDFVSSLPYYKTVEVNGRTFFLCHSGPGNFKKKRTPESYTKNELIWYRPKVKDKFYENITTVFGHTPTFVFSPKYQGRILTTPTWIDIDVGAAAGLPPAFLRLDDMKEFYF